MITMADRAGRWIRVSGDSQSEEDQLPDINAYCDDRQYIKGRIYEVHGKSAFKGAQDPDWQRVVEDFRSGQIDVVVCWMVDRLDRQNILHAIPMVLAVLDAGGRIEFSEQPECNLDASAETIDEDVKAFADRIHAANQESKIKSKRVNKAFRKRREIGSVIGRAPWGFRIHCTVCNRKPVRETCKGHKKIFAPTADGRTYIPLIFQEVIKGRSAPEVCAWLDAQGVKTMGGKPWNEGYLSTRVIKNPVYYGQRRNSGTLETEALVTYSVWQQANEMLSSRARPGRGTVVRDKVFLSPVCGNPDCDATGEHPSPMYRIYNGTSKDRQPHYRCTGRGPQRKGCGLLVPVAEFDAIVTEAMLTDHANSHYDRVFIPGDDRSDAIGRLREQAMDAYRQGDKARFTELDAQADALAAMETIRPQWKETDSGMTRGQYFATLDAGGRREYMAAYWQVFAFRHDDGTVGAVISPREMAA
jgi:DNA invertase Pin-like site-specific DNA recombinase